MHCKYKRWERFREPIKDTYSSLHTTTLPTTLGIDKWILQLTSRYIMAQPVNVILRKIGLATLKTLIFLWL